MVKKMPLGKNQKIFLFFGFNLVWGIVLWWSISRYGMGTSRDSAEYLFTSLSLDKGQGFISFSGQPFVLWPPLYPILLAVIQCISRLNPYESAEVLQLITLFLISFCIAQLFLRAFPNNFWLSFIGNSMATVGVSMTMLFQGVGADYLHLLLILGIVLVGGKYMKDHRIQNIWLMALISALAMLQRYLGLAVFITSIFLIFLFPWASSLWVRIKRSLWMGLSIIPVGLWILNVSTITLQRAPPESFAQNLSDFTTSILRWFFSNNAMFEHPLRLQAGVWIVWLVLIGSIILIASLNKQRAYINNTTLPVILYGLMYTVTLFGVSAMSFFNKLDDRFVSPMYIPCIFLIMLTIQVLTEKIRASRIAWLKLPCSASIAGILLLFLGLTLNQSLQQVFQIRFNGAGYTSKEWRENNALKYWQKNAPQGNFIVLSNYPSGIVFYTWHEVLPSPRRSPNPNVKEIIYPIEEYAPTLFEAGKKSYLIWIEPNSYSHVYSIDELRQIAEIKVLYEEEDGGVYQLSPLQNTYTH